MIFGEWSATNIWGSKTHVSFRRTDRWFYWLVHELSPQVLNDTRHDLPVLEESSPGPVFISIVSLIPAAVQYRNPLTI